ncbi:glycopeptide [Rhodocollybia butyracea]|uniref:Glycopeptide n=1 Tax=Rhodocollybia butyracea TaxID=206335 RepID=A0A9P5Q3X7_9AGAR|nr:glycopeptide [Rhodocollybia butyracea]
MQFIASLVALASFIAIAAAESHTITFNNKCGKGTPMLISQTGQVLSKGGSYTSNGPIVGALAYLQTGGCGLNGDFCTTVETTLKNPTSPGAGSSSDVTLIPDHKFTVSAGFGYFNGCDGVKFDCTSANCPGAFTNPTNGKVVSCQTDNVDLAITFCD